MIDPDVRRYITNYAHIHTVRRQVRNRLTHEAHRQEMIIDALLSRSDALSLNIQRQYQTRKRIARCLHQIVNQYDTLLTQTEQAEQDNLMLHINMVEYWKQYLRNHIQPVSNKPKYAWRDTPYLVSEASRYALNAIQGLEEPSKNIDTRLFSEGA